MQRERQLDREGERVEERGRDPDLAGSRPRRAQDDTDDDRPGRSFRSRSRPSARRDPHRAGASRGDSRTARRRSTAPPPAAQPLSGQPAARKTGNASAIKSAERRACGQRAVGERRRSGQVAEHRALKTSVTLVDDEDARGNSCGRAGRRSDRRYRPAPSRSGRPKPASTTIVRNKESTGPRGLETTGAGERSMPAPRIPEYARSNR